jgi:hypothetical protein
MHNLNCKLHDHVVILAAHSRIRFAAFDVVDLGPSGPRVCFTVYTVLFIDSRV